MRALNREWRDDDHPTDVLSFPAYEPQDLPKPGAPAYLGDLALNADAVLRQHTDALPERLLRLGALAEELQPWGIVEEATFLLVHGVLHLLGHDHAEPEEEAAMVAEELRLLRPFLAPPWRG